jgi:ribosome maturation factor RimP
LIPTNCVEIKTIIPKETLLKISTTEPADEGSKRDKYIWNVFPSELDTLSQFSKEINIYLDKKKNLAIRIHLSIESEGILNRSKRAILRYRDLRLIFNILYRLYNDFYILHV